MAAMGLTLAVEAPLVAWYVRRWRPPIGRVIAAGLLPSLLTHPFAWQAWSRLGPHDYLQGVLLIECAVWLVESIMLRMLLPLKWHQALLLSLLANAASTALGWLVW